jgi:hypothetical protein
LLPDRELDLQGVTMGVQLTILWRTSSFTRSSSRVPPDTPGARCAARVLKDLQRFFEGRPDSPKAWLGTVARNAHPDRARRAARKELRGEARLLAQLSP